MGVALNVSRCFMSVTKSITEHIRQRPGGSVFMRREIVNHFRGHESVTSRVLERLAASGELLHIDRGLWWRAKHTRFGEVLPSPEDVVSALERNRDVLIVPAGARILNDIGASTQLPLKPRYIATRRIKPVALGKATIEFDYNRAFESTVGLLTGLSRSEKKRVAGLWVAFCYVGDNHAAHEREAFTKAFQALSSKEQEMLLEVLTGKLVWARSILV